jgi:hypothetical protein
MNEDPEAAEEAQLYDMDSHPSISVETGLIKVLVNEYTLIMTRSDAEGLWAELGMALQK